MQVKYIGPFAPGVIVDLGLGRGEFCERFGTIEVDDELGSRLCQQSTWVEVAEPIVIDQRLMDVLVNAGFSEASQINEASNEELLSIDGVGEAKLKQIREYFPAREDGE